MTLPKPQPPLSEAQIKLLKHGAIAAGAEADAALQLAPYGVSSNEEADEANARIIGLAGTAVKALDDLEAANRRIVVLEEAAGWKPTKVSTDLEDKVK